MSLGLKARSSSAQSPGNRAAQGRMSGWDLLFLAAGGVIGSGWMFAGTRVDQTAPGWWAVAAWLIGGLLVVAVTAVMVEVSTKVPKTGGLIFLPLQTSGPLLTTLVAAGVWGFYAASPAGESTAMVQNLAAWGHWPALFSAASDSPTWGGIGLAALFLLLVTAVNLLGPRRFLSVNNVLTAFKIFIPLLIVVVLGSALIWPPAHPVLFPPAPAVRAGSGPASGGLSSALGAIVSGGVIYAYLGFQGPLDFAGNVRGGGIGEAARLRRAVYGTVLGSILLYVALQGVIIYLRYHSAGDVDVAGTAANSPSAYIAFADAVVRPHWLASGVAWLVSLDSVLSPAGTALVFTYVMTREVAALSRAHLTHRGLQRSKNSVIRLPEGFLRKVFADDRLDVYWWILFVDFVISLLILLFTRGYWSVIQDIPTILALLVYATPGIVLAALRQREPDLFPRRRYALIAEASFAVLAVVFVLATSGVLEGMLTLAVFCLVLFGLPVAVPRARWYDARNLVREFGQLRTSRAAQLGAVLGGYFAVLTIAEAVRRAWPSRAGAGWDLAGLALVVTISLVAFHWLVRLSVMYMADNPPLLPRPLPRGGRQGGTTEAGS
jgi:amino acid transporter